MKIGYVMESGVPDVREARPTGPATHVHHTVTELRRLGHEVRVVARLDGTTYVSDDLRDFRPVRVSGVDTGWPRRFEGAVRRVQAALGLPYVAHFDSHRFAAHCQHVLTGVQLVYERMGWLGLGGSLAARRMRVPHVLEVNGDLPVELDMLGMSGGAAQRYLSGRLMGALALAATHAVATGEGWRARHVARWGVAGDAVSVIQNGTEIVDLLERRRLRAFELDEGSAAPLRLAFVGAFEPWQGLSLLLTAVARIVAAGVDLQVFLAGSGRLERQIDEEIAALGLVNRVSRVGHVGPRALADLLSRCDVGVSLYTGRAEFSGLKILDYKGAGLATVAAGRDGQPSVIRDGMTGQIVAPGSEDELVGALVRLAGNRSAVREMGRRARFEAETQHRWRHTAEALDRLFQQLAGNAMRETVRQAG